MENTPWRLIFFAAGASLALLILIFVIVLPKDIETLKKSEKIAEFKKTYVSGHEKGQKVWEFFAEYGWSGKDKKVTYLEKVKNGTLFKNGDVITKNLNAPEVKAYPNTRVLEAFSKEKIQIFADIAFTKKESGERRFAKVRADYLIYNPDSEKTNIKGNIRFKDKDVVMTCGDMLVDHKEENALLNDKVKINRKDIFLSTNVLFYDSKYERLDASGNVKSAIKAKQKTFVNSDYMTLFVGEDKDIDAKGHLSLVQGKKSAVANSGLYNKVSEKIILTGDVKAVIDKGKDLLKGDTIGKLHNPDAKKLLKEKTFITSDNLVFSTKNGDAKAYGNVYVYQKDREAKAEIADYMDSEEIIYLTKNVYLKQESGWVKCEEVNVSVKDETFEAVGSVEAEFKIKK